MRDLLPRHFLRQNECDVNAVLLIGLVSEHFHFSSSILMVLMCSAGLILGMVESYVVEEERYSFSDF